MPLAQAKKWKYTYYIHSQFSFPQECFREKTKPVCAHVLQRFKYPLCRQLASGGVDPLLSYELVRPGIRRGVVVLFYALLPSLSTL